MAAWLEKLLVYCYARIPAALRPAFRSVFFWGQIRAEALVSRRRVRYGQRVSFLDFEIAHLEPFEYLSPRPNEVEIKTHCSTVSPGTERAVLCGLPGARKTFPYFPGYSCAGEIVATGSRVKGFKLGDRIAGRVRHLSGESVGTDFIFHIPEGVSYESASLIELGIITLQGLRKARIQPGDVVAVLGQGLIGQLAGRLARAGGASRVIAIAPTRNRARAALAPGGATEFVAMRESAFSPSSIAADVVIEAVGTPDAIATATLCARPGGRVVLLGSSRGLSRNVNLAALLQHRDIELVGAHISDMPATEASPGRHTYRQEGELFLDMLRTGRLSVTDLVTWRAAPDECNAVYETLAKGGREHVAMVLEWQRSVTNGK